MNQFSIPWISIILFAIIASPASSQTLQQAISSQNNEQLTLELYNYFNTVRSDITISPKSNYASASSGASLVSQALASKQDNLQTFIASDQLQVSSSTSVRIEVSTSDYLNYLFKYLLITLQADKSIQVTTTSTATLTLQTAGMIHGLSFSTSTAGYFSVSTPIDKNLNYIGSLTYSDANGLAVSVSSINIQLKSIKPYYFESTQYLILTTNTSIGLATIAQSGNGYQWSILTSTINSDCLISSFVLSSMYPLFVCQTAQLTYRISALFFVANTFTQVYSASFATDTTLFTNILSYQSLNGMVYLFSSDTVNSNQLYVSQVLLNKSTNELSIQMFSVIVPSGYLSYNFPMYIQADNLLVCFTATSVLGYNFISGSLLFERTTYSVLNFQLFKILNFGATYQLVYQSTSDTTSTTAIQYFLSIPAFTFMLTSASPSVYVLTLGSDLSTLTVTSQLLSSKIEQCTYMKTSSIVFNSMIEVPQLEGTVSYNIEQTIVCSDLELGNPYIWMNDEFYDIMWSVKAISQVGSSEQTDILPPTDYQIYPTQGSQFLVVAGMVTMLTEVSTENSNNSFSLQMACTESFLGAPLQTDINGFYSYQGSSLTQQIALPFQQPGTKQNNCNLPTITTTCAKKNSATSQAIPFLFASDPLQAKVFSLCNSVLTIYSYGLSSFSSTAASTQISFTFTAQPTQAIAIAGKLFISDSKTYIVIYHYNLPQGYSETISIPQTLGTIQSLILFSESYLLRVTDASSATIAYVLPYSNNASPLRTLQYFGYTPDFSTAVPIYQTLQLPTIINEAQRLPQMQEYYILPAINATSIQSILVFRISQVSAKNQLYKIIDLKKPLNNNKIFASSSGYLGFVDSSNNVYLYKLNYMMVLQFEVGVDDPTKAFTSQPYTTFSAYFSINSGSYIYPQIYLNKDVSAANAVIDSTNTDASSLTDYFSEFINLSETETIDVNLTNAVTSNVFGWLPSQKGLNPPVTILLSNRVDVTLQDSQIIGLCDTLYFLPNLTIISYNQTVQISKNPINMLYPDPYLFYDPTTMTNSTITDTNGNLISSTISVDIYSIASDYENLQQSLLAMQLIATYKPTFQTPSLQISSSTKSRNAPELNYDETITRIQSDPKLGLLLLKKTKQSMTQTICLVKITDKSFTIDCDSLSFINSLGILDIIWIPSMQLNIFISSNNILYTGFTLTGGSNQVFALDLYSYTRFLQTTSNFKTLALGGSIRSNSILISYDQVNAVELSITSSYQGDPFDISPLNVYLGENHLQLTGQGTALSDTESLLVAVDIENNVVYELVYSKYSTSTSDNTSFYNIIRASGGQSVHDVTIFNGQAKISPLISPQSESVQILLNSYPGENPLGINFTVSPLITISMAQTDSNADYDGVGAYLQLEGTIMNKSNSIPLDINLGQSNHKYKSGINLKFTLWIVAIWLILQ